MRAVLRATTKGAIFFAIFVLATSGAILLALERLQEASGVLFD